MNNNKRVTIKILKDFNFDHRRIWRLATVWLDDLPVMVIQNAGREGDDYWARFITSDELYVELVNYIYSICPLEIYSTEDDLIDDSIDMPILTHFYSTDLDGDWKKSK